MTLNREGQHTHPMPKSNQFMHELGIGTMRNMKSVFQAVFTTLCICKPYEMRWVWSFSIYIGLELIIWTQTEMPMISAVHWLHALYMGWA